jgi:hypothetical protein
MVAFGSAYYREQEALCWRDAQTAKQVDTRQAWEDLEQQWRLLAEDAECGERWPGSEHLAGFENASGRI